MHTLLFIYVFIYVYSLYIVILYCIISNFSTKLFQFSLSQLLSGLTFYKKELNWLRLVLLQLSGIPPFIYFFIKFYIIVGSLNKLSYVLCCLVFLNLLLGVFFYLKIFFYTAFNYSRETLRNFSAPLSNNNFNYKVMYTLTYNIFFFFFINIFSCVFILDILLLLCRLWQP